MNYSDYASRNSSEYVYNVQTLAGQFSTSIVQSILRIISEGIVGILILIFLALNSGIAFYIFLIILILSVYFYDKSFKKKNNEYGVIVNSSSTSMIQSIQEAMFGYKENHIYGITGHFNNLVHIFANKLAAARVKSMVISTSSRYVIELVVITFIAMVAILATLMGKETTFIISTITMFGVASLRLMPSAIQILISFGNIRYGKNSVDKLYYDVQKYSTEINDFNTYKIDLDHNNQRINSFSETFESIELQNIDFAYQKDAEPILENINLRVRKGEMIGIIGASGSGKTTLMDILLGFLNPISGRISFNGKLMNHNVSEWSSKVAYIPQEVFIADSSLRSNIALGVLEDEIDEEKIELAIKQSQLKRLVDKLDDGVNTSIGERGVRLSGGEKQRIALARAIYHQRDVLFLDESTSALDMETEEQILTEINSLKGLKTFIIVAHNYETLKFCDEIYEVSDKKLISKGTFKELKNNLF